MSENEKLVERLRAEASAMQAAPSGEQVGDTFHAANWSDKPHRVLYDAVKAIREAAAALTAAEGRIKDLEREKAAALGLVEGHARIIAAYEAAKPVAGEAGHVEIAHDGFAGDIIGSYTTREGKRGVVVQQDGTRVVHVYGVKWIDGQVEAKPLAPMSTSGGMVERVAALVARVMGRDNHAVVSQFEI